MPMIFPSFETRIALQLFIIMATVATGVVSATTGNDSPITLDTGSMFTSSRGVPLLMVPKMSLSEMLPTGNPCEKTGS